MNADAVLAAWLARPDPTLLGPAVLRLGRAVSAFREGLDALPLRPVERALAGLAPVELALASDDREAAWLAVVGAEAGEALDPGALAALEARARGRGEQVLVARARVLVDGEREREARRTLANQELPYVMPGELHPLVVDLLAAGDRVLPALHVDHVRKLTALAADALVLDARAVGLWFWPVLRALAPDRLRAPLARLPAARRLPPGGRGLAAAYLLRVGADADAALLGASEADLLLAALATLGDRSDPA